MTTNLCCQCGRRITSTTVPNDQMAELIDAAAELFNVPAVELLGRNQRQRACLVRYVCMAALRERHGVSYLEIGDLFDRDHTTALYGVRKAPPEMVAALLAAL